MYVDGIALRRWRPRRPGRRAFTLIEITLAILVFATGILAVFALFPESLETSRRAVEDTHVALFAGATLAGIRANCSEITEWDDWTGPTFTTLATANLSHLGTVKIGELTMVSYPSTNDYLETHVRYILKIEDAAGAQQALKTVTLQADGRRAGPFNPATFYTEVYFRGSAPR